MLKGTSNDNLLLLLILLIYEAKSDLFEFFGPETIACAYEVRVLL